MKKQVAVIFGGKSSEHDVSCVSVVNVVKGFNKDKYEVTLIGITKEGKWLLTDSIASIEDGSWKDGTTTAIISPDQGKQGILILKDGVYEHKSIDVIFPVLHGKFGEDGTIQGLFEMSGIPYVGCGVLSSAASMDKISTKIFVEKLGIRQANFVTDIARDLGEMEETVRQVEEKLGYPVFVKPSNAGSSCGVSKASDRQQLKDAIALAKEHDTRVLIEEMIVGHEVECAVLGGDKVEASRVGEVVAAAEFYDYEAKYHNADSKTVIDPEEVPAESKERVRESAVKIFKAVSGFGLSRVDFFIENETNDVVFNEINTLPGFTNISMYPMLWNDMGLSREELIDRLVETAYER
nr:D-alanine--D-alanine ligase [Eubacterium sp.]